MECLRNISKEKCFQLTVRWDLLRKKVILLMIFLFDKVLSNGCVNLIMKIVREKGAVHVLLSRFYPDFIQILSRFFRNSLYPDVILILS